MFSVLIFGKTFFSFCQIFFPRNTFLSDSDYAKCYFDKMKGFSPCFYTTNVGIDKLVMHVIFRFFYSPPRAVDFSSCCFRFVMDEWPSR